MGVANAETTAARYEPEISDFKDCGHWAEYPRYGVELRNRSTGSLVLVNHSTRGDANWS